MYHVDIQCVGSVSGCLKSRVTVLILVVQQQQPCAAISLELATLYVSMSRSSNSLCTHNVNFPVEEASAYIIEALMQGGDRA